MSEGILAKKQPYSVTTYICNACCLLFKVEVGDIISEIDGKVTHAMTPDMISKIIKATGGKRPISISVTKTYTKELKVL